MPNAYGLRFSVARRATASYKHWPTWTKKRQLRFSVTPQGDRQVTA
ncbi:hypothetical protein [Streptomyces caelestis]